MNDGQPKQQTPFTNEMESALEMLRRRHADIERRLEEIEREIDELREHMTKQKS